MSARRVDVTREREPADDGVSVLGQVDGRIGMPADGAQIPPLIGDAPPLRTRQKPRALLAAHVARELDERLRIARLRSADGDHGTTIP